jgi:hypothetical protein
MAALRSISGAAALCLAASLSTSCIIRLPGPPAGDLHRVEVSSPPAQEPAGTTVEPDDRDPDVLVWLIADTLHTCMVFEYDWLIESGFIPPAGFGHPKYVTLSWGDRTAYQEKRLDSAWKVFKALFLPTGSVMELIPANWHVVEVCPHQRIWRKLVPRENGRALAAYLNHCSVTADDGRPIVCGTSSWGGGVLLESRHTYYFPRICNVWTVQAIEAMGGKMNPWTAVSANGLIRQAEKHNDFEQIWWGGGKPSADDAP